MDAGSIKKWTIEDGDYSAPVENDYDMNYRWLRRHKRLFTQKITWVFGIMALGAIVLIVELVTRY
jgi:hypothetical protein